MVFFLHIGVWLRHEWLGGGWLAAVAGCCTLVGWLAFVVLHLNWLVAAECHAMGVDFRASQVAATVTVTVFDPFDPAI